MRTVYTGDHRLHAGRFELYDGGLHPCVEKPERAEIVLARVREVGLGEVVAPRRHGLDPVRRVHADGLLAFLETAWERWSEAHGDERDALPLCWPARGMRRDVEPASIDGALGRFCFDAGTPITAGTWPAARAAADVALTAAGLLAAGEPAAFALCRPPGHHAAQDVFGGYCFLNNAAIAAQALVDGGAGRVAVLDIDYHHGNGTQLIFYDRADVVVASIHADPAWEFPFFLGHADERGAGAGEGFNLNYPLSRGTGFGPWARALDDACARIAAFRPNAVVVSLGLDTFERDPISTFRLRTDDYPRIGARIARLGRPTLFVLEGGYAVEELGANAVNVLAGFEQAPR